RRHTRFSRDWSSDVCSSDLAQLLLQLAVLARTMHESAEAFLQLGDEAHGLLLRPSDRFTGASPSVTQRARSSHRDAESLAHAEKIGRASWRERGAMALGAVG